MEHVLRAILELLTIVCSGATAFRHPDTLRALQGARAALQRELDARRTTVL